MDAWLATSLALRHIPGQQTTSSSSPSKLLLDRLSRAASSAVPLGAGDEEIHRFATPRGGYARFGRQCAWRLTETRGQAKTQGTRVIPPPGPRHYLVGPLQLYGASLVAYPRIEVRKQRFGAAKGERLTAFKDVRLQERVHPGPVRGNNQLVVAQQGLRQTVQRTARGFQAALQRSHLLRAKPK